ncbi:hypothetical protein HD593_005364 [Nonomuraea rubra]|uniref:Uncharacterized protein n=1 Tax=Nonomuraea rubra TaxID=46180 RepID=A0A7X0NVT4_9ACTN|nr:hypothetical protein [Nonomuraea rubra]
MEVHTRDRPTPALTPHDSVRPPNRKHTGPPPAAPGLTRIATRYDKPAGRYLAGVTIASLILWLRQAELSDTLWWDTGRPGEARAGS